MLLIFPNARWIHVYDYPWMIGIPQNIENPPPKKKKKLGGGAERTITDVALVESARMTKY